MRKRIIAVVVGALSFVLGIAAAPAHAAPAIPPAQFYLALGDSLAAGYQPGIGDNKTGGYVGKVWHAEYAMVPNTQLVNDACSGERTDTMINGGICTYATGSQLNEAVAFLRSHPGRTGLITIDIGANNVDSCINPDGSINFPCVQAGVAQMQNDIPIIFGKLRQYAPNAQIIVANYYDPFLAAWLTGGPGSQGRSTARASVSLVHSINNIIGGNASNIGAPVANVMGTFITDDFTRHNYGPPFGYIPTNVYKICQWTYMCSQQNIHPNDGGYSAIARTVIPLLAAPSS